MRERTLPTDRGRPPAAECAGGWARHRCTAQRPLLVAVDQFGDVSEAWMCTWFLPACARIAAQCACQFARRMHYAMAQRGTLTSHGDAAPKSAQPPAMALRLGEYVVPARPRHRVTRIFLLHHFSRAWTRRRWWWRCRLASRGEARAQRRGGVASCKARAASSSSCGRRRSPRAISGMRGFVGHRTTYRKVRKD